MYNYKINIYIYILNVQEVISLSSSCRLSVAADGVFQTGLMALIKWKHLLGRCSESLSSLILQDRMASSCCLFHIRLPALRGLLMLDASVARSTCTSKKTTSRELTHKLALSLVLSPPRSVFHCWSHFVSLGPQAKF